MTLVETTTETRYNTPGDELTNPKRPDNYDEADTVTLVPNDYKPLLSKY